MVFYAMLSGASIGKLFLGGLALMAYIAFITGERDSNLLLRLSGHGAETTPVGVVIVLNMMIGLWTPPMGMLLSIVSGISGTPLKTVIKEALPMIIVLLIPNIFGR